MCQIHTTKCMHCNHLMAYYKTSCIRASVALQTCGQINHETSLISAEGCIKCWQKRHAKREWNLLERLKKITYRRGLRHLEASKLGGKLPMQRGDIGPPPQKTIQGNKDENLLSRLRKAVGQDREVLKSKRAASATAGVSRGMILNPYTLPPSTCYTVVPLRPGSDTSWG